MQLRNWSRELLCDDINLIYLVIIAVGVLLRRVRCQRTKKVCAEEDQDQDKEVVPNRVCNKYKILVIVIGLLANNWKKIKLMPAKNRTRQEYVTK